MCKRNHLFTTTFFIKCVPLSSLAFDADTISPLQQTGLGPTCFENLLMRRDNVQLINNNPIGLGSSNGAT
jgi:hypothetical protein